MPHGPRHGKSATNTTPADVAFSLCVRERAEWRCENCGTQHNPSSVGLGCSHHHGRGNWSIRFSPLNGESLCTACHYAVGGTEERRQEVLTKQEQDILWELKADTNLGREYKRTKGKGAVAKHYRDEFKRMQDLRASGVTGRIEFVGWI